MWLAVISYYNIIIRDRPARPIKISKRTETSELNVGN